MRRPSDTRRQRGSARILKVVHVEASIIRVLGHDALVLVRSLSSLGRKPVPNRSGEVAIATAAQARGSDEDEPLLIAALESAGARARPVVWDDPTVDWSSFDAVVVRSTWDYPARRREFLTWADRVGSPRLHNSPEVLWWNTDKIYLRALARRGVATVPTTWITPNDSTASLPETGEYVVKPSVSAGSRDTARYTPDEEERATEHVRRIQESGRTTMVQPYVAGVDTVGETALIFIGGQYSHAVRKAPLLSPGGGTVEGLFTPEKIALREPSPTERAVAAHIVTVARDLLGDLRYARVDLVPGPDAAPLLLELELTEPSLFLSYAPAAAERFATVIREQIT